MYSTCTIAAVSVFLLAGQARAQLKADADAIDKEIRALRAGGNAAAFAMKRLVQYDGPLPEKQEEVAALLMKAVKDQKKYDAMRALAVWATPAELKEIPDYLGNDDMTKAAIFVLGKKKVGEQAKAIADYLGSGGGKDREALDALTEIGPPAEEAVIPYLDKKGKERGFAITILTKIGGKATLDALAKMPEDKRDKDAVKVAIARIEERIKKAEKDKHR